MAQITTTKDRQMFEADANRLAKLCASTNEADAHEAAIEKRGFADIVQKATKAPLWTPEHIKRYYPVLMEMAALAESAPQDSPYL